MSSFTESKIAIGLRQVTQDIEAQCVEMPSPTARKRWRAFQDRINGYAAELEAEMGGTGTTAYEMMAAAETANMETTETLIHMVAATVLSLGIDPANQHQVFGQADGSYAVSFSPQDMDAMHRGYQMDATRDGMITTVRIMPISDLAPPLPPAEAHLEAKPESLMRQDEPETAFEPQAEAAVYDRPLWAIRYADKNGKQYLASMHDRADAARHINDYVTLNQPDPTIENRFCLHPDCPSERCNHDDRLNTTQDMPEVASDS